MNTYADTQKTLKKYDSIPEAKDLKKDVTEFTNSNQSIVSNMKDATTEAIGDTTETVKASVNYAKKEGEKTFHNVETFVKENPAKGMAYALGIGAILTYFMLPRR